MSKEKFARILTKIFLVLSILLFALLSITSFMDSYVNSAGIHNERVYRVPDYIPTNVLFILIIALAMYAVRYYLTPFISKINTVYVMLCVSALMLLFGLYWVNATGTTPQGDQFVNAVYAEFLSHPDYTSFNYGEYITVYPQQLGYITFLRLVFAIFGSYNFLAVQCINVFFMVGIVVFGYLFVRKITSSRSAELMFLLLSFTCIPLYFYTPYVYGEIPSLFFIMLATYMLSLMDDKISIPKTLIMCIALGLGIYLRKNTIIVSLAFIAVLLVKLIGTDKKINWIIQLISVTVASLLFSALVTAPYKSYFPDNSNGMPAWSWIAMGTHDVDGFAGWYDSSNIDTFTETNYDSVLTSGIAKAQIKDFTKHCLHEPEYAFSFFRRKYESQWNTPMYQSLVMNNNIDKPQTDFAEKVYFGELTTVCDEFMNIYQILVFSLVFVLLLKSWSGKRDITHYVLLVAVLGGFIFSLMWEAKPRYIFPYFVMMLPYAAISFHRESHESDSQEAPLN